MLLHCIATRWQDLELLAACLPPRATTRFCRDWDDFISSLRQADCSLAVERTPEEPATAARIRSLSMLQHDASVVLVVRCGQYRRSRMRLLPIAITVCLEDGPGAVTSAIRHAHTRGVLRRLALRCRDSTTLPNILASALIQLLENEQPIVSIGDLARRVGRDRSTLWHSWRSHVGAQPRLEDFVEWLVLLRAIAKKTPQRSWRTVARSLGVHEHTLMRLGRRLAQTRLRDITTQRATDLLQEFADNTSALLHLPTTICEQPLQSGTQHP